jgi:hypothetical protein
VELPTRLVDTSYSYIARQEESVAMESLFDYLDSFLRAISTSRTSVEYCRLLLFAAFSSPESLLKLLNNRRQYLVTSQFENTFTGDMLRPASHRLESNRIKSVIYSLPEINSEQLSLESLIWQVDAWQK